ncbi:MAG: GNAT family N-acetyltransferase [Gemmatimonadota bacterium]
MTRDLTATSASLISANQSDASAIAALRVAVADRLTANHGKGPWSLAGTIRSVHRALLYGDLLVLRRDNAVVATLILTRRKPWAIDTQYFAPARRPLYLTSMAVDPAWQQQGVGRACLAEVDRLAASASADTLRLDAFDAPAGAGPFYEKCGYREVKRVSYQQMPLIYYERSITPHS